MSDKGKIDATMQADAIGRDGLVVQSGEERL
jgi:hypothetical protein